MLKYMCILVLLFTPVTGCTPGSVDYLKKLSQKSRFMRKVMPRPYRTQIFSNLATHYNQQYQEDEYGYRVPKELGVLDDDATLAKLDPEYGDSYGHGFQDGCDMAMTVMGAGLFRLIPDRHKAEKLLQDNWYLRGFQDGRMFCVHRTDWEVH